jgi:hypothetical protein
MGFETWPEKRGEDYADQLDALRQGWRCTRRECLFHGTYCRQSKVEKAVP